MTVAGGRPEQWNWLDNETFPTLNSATLGHKACSCSLGLCFFAMEQIWEICPITASEIVGYTSVILEKYSFNIYHFVGRLLEQAFSTMGSNSFISLLLYLIILKYKQF